MYTGYSLIRFSNKQSNDLLCKQVRKYTTL